MAKIISVWGIDVGQCALKALRCKKDGDEIVAEAFDYVEYPKILSQPESEPEKLVKEALETFLSRNDVKDCRIAISVPGQSGLAKFFKPPPVDAKKIPDIVKYEARQQIPFNLEDVIWDFQQMGGGIEADGFALDTEVGLFAMKREQVWKAIKPFQDAGIELDIVQLAPISTYNFVAYDLLSDGPAPDAYDPDDPPESVIVLSIGTDTTDLVVTNGFRLWQRSIPLGGNHFTKQLTKDLKLTFAKAEHLKRNARQSEDPKAVFQAMRPVFNDLVTEVQRSLSFFQGIDRKAKLGGVVLLGNTVKLPGLQQYLAKNLGHEIVDFDSFSRLTGSSVVSSPSFRDNLPAFGVGYGLCLQGLGLSSLRTNLVPREILTERLIRAKKPWALVGVAALVLGCTFSTLFSITTRSSVLPEFTRGTSWKTAESAMDTAASTSNRNETDHRSRETSLTQLTKIGNELVGNNDRRIVWMEFLNAFNQQLPKNDPKFPPGGNYSPKELPFKQRRDIHLPTFTVKYYADLKTWFTESVKADYMKDRPDLSAPKTDQQAQSSGSNANKDFKPPEGPGYVITLQCYHYHNDKRNDGDSHRNYVVKTLLRNLDEGVATLPSGQYTMKELGIGYATILGNPQPDWNFRVKNPILADPGGGGGGDGGMGGSGMSGMGGAGMSGMGGGGMSGMGGAGMSGMGGGGMSGMGGAGMSGMGGGGMSGMGGAGMGGSGTGGGTAGSGGGGAKKVNPDEPLDFEAPRYLFTLQFCWQPKMLTDRVKEREAKQKETQAKQDNVATNP